MKECHTVTILCRGSCRKVALYCAKCTSSALSYIDNMGDTGHGLAVG